VLGHPARIAILQKLLEVDCCISRDFSDDIDLAQPTISRHIKELVTARLIEGTTEGTRTRYRISPTRWREVQALLNGVFDSFRDGCC
jgi:DNA-binding transcriptional ArsR family regulator